MTGVLEKICSLEGHESRVWSLSWDPASGRFNCH